jgi:hypothetical protein
MRIPIPTKTAAMLKPPQVEKSRSLPRISQKAAPRKRTLSRTRASRPASSLSFTPQA